MNKFFKYGLLGVGGVMLLAAGGVAYIAATFDPNDYKSRIIQLVKDKQQRTLKLDGDIKLTFFPGIGADLGKVSLSEFNSDKEFVSVESAHVSLALLPLLSRQVVVDEVRVSGLKAVLVKHKDGQSNIADLMGKKEAGEASPAVQFDIAAVRIENAELVYRDEVAATQYALKNLNLQTGRIANGVPGKIDFAATIQASQPKLDMAAQLKATLTFDLEKKMYQVRGLDLQARGALLDIGNLTVQASGDASAQLATQEFSATKLRVSASGNKGKDRFDAKLDVPALNLTRDQFTSEQMSLTATLDSTLGNLVAKLNLPGLEGSRQSFKSDALTLDVDLKQAQQAFKVKLSSPVDGNFEARQFNLSKLVLAVNATGDKLPNKSVSSEMKGSALLDAGREGVQINLAGGLLQSQIAVKLALNNFSNPAIRFEVEADQFDADTYLPQRTEVGDSKAATAAAPEPPLDLSALKNLNMEGSLRIGALKVANVKLAQLRLDMKARDGLVNISPLSANLYQGGFTGSVSVNAAQAKPSFAIAQSLSGINLGALLKDAADLDSVSGKGSMAFNLTTQGNTVTALKNALNGNISLSLANGIYKLPGKSISGELQGNVQLDGGRQNLQANLSGKVQQSKFTAKLALHDLADPAIRFDVVVDQFDADEYLPKTVAGDAKKPAVREQPLDLSALKKLNMEGSLRIGAFKVINARLAQVRLDMKAHQGRVNIDPLSADLYQGRMNGSLAVNAAPAVPTFAITGNLGGINIAPLVKDLMDLDALEGKGNVSLDLNTQGNTVSGLKKALGGSAKFDLANGAIKGINLTKLIRSAQTLGKSGSQTQGMSKDEKTEFSEFKAGFKVNDGVAHNDDLAVRSQLLRLTGNGDINIGNDSLNYTAKATLYNAPDGQGGSVTVPVRLSGPYADLKYNVDFGAMLADIARQKFDAKKDEVADRLKEQLNKKLKGLFK